MVNDIEEEKKFSIRMSELALAQNEPNSNSRVRTKLISEGNMFLNLDKDGIIFYCSL